MEKSIFEFNFFLANIERAKVNDRLLINRIHKYHKRILFRESYAVWLILKYSSEQTEINGISITTQQSINHVCNIRNPSSFIIKTYSNPKSEKLYKITIAYCNSLAVFEKKNIYK